MLRLGTIIYMCVRKGLWNIDNNDADLDYLALKSAKHREKLAEQSMTLTISNQSVNITR